MSTVKLMNCVTKALGMPRHELLSSAGRTFMTMTGHGYVSGLDERNLYFLTTDKLDVLMKMWDSRGRDVWNGVCIVYAAFFFDDRKPKGIRRLVPHQNRVNSERRILAASMVLSSSLLKLCL